MALDDGLTDEEHELLETTADEAIESTLFQSGTRGIGNDMEDMVENIVRGARKWTHILVGILIRTLQEKWAEETYPTGVRIGDVREIEDIVEKREDQIRESQIWSDGRREASMHDCHNATALAMAATMQIHELIRRWFAQSP